MEWNHIYYLPLVERFMYNIYNNDNDIEHRAIGWGKWGS